jgi:hypothetical protein
MDMKFKTIEQEEFVNLVSLNEKEIQNNEKLKSKFYKKRGATFFYDITRKLGPRDFTPYRSKS